MIDWGESDAEPIQMKQKRSDHPGGGPMGEGKGKAKGKKKAIAGGDGD